MNYSRTKDETQRRTTYGHTAQKSTSDSDRKTDNAQPGTTQGPKTLPQDYRMKNNSPTDNHTSSEDHHKQRIMAAIFKQLLNLFSNMYKKQYSDCVK